jgi:hypothetical protein
MGWLGWLPSKLNGPFNGNTRINEEKINENNQSNKSVHVNGGTKDWVLSVEDAILSLLMTKGAGKNICTQYLNITFNVTLVVFFESYFC